MHRDDAAQVLVDHRQGALRKVAEAVGEFGVAARHDGVVAVAAVLTEADLAQEEIAKIIDAVAVGEVERVDDVAAALGHFLAALEQKTVAINAFRQRQTGRKQECGPVNRVESHDILADQVQIGGPETAPSALRRRG
jgi:hypothetical protein